MGYRRVVFAQASATESHGLPPVERSTQMPLPDSPADNETLVREAQAARVLAHVRMILSGLKPRASKALSKVL